MEILKKLLILCMIPASILATGSENKKGLLIKRKINHENLTILSSFPYNSQYRERLMKALKELKIEPASVVRGNKLDLHDLESTISEEARKSCEQKVNAPSDSINRAFDHFKNHIHPKAVSRAAYRSFGLGALTGVLVTIAYSNYSKIKSYFSGKK